MGVCSSTANKSTNSNAAYSNDTKAMVNEKSNNGENGNSRKTNDKANSRNTSFKTDFNFEPLSKMSILLGMFILLKLFLLF